MSRKYFLYFMNGATDLQMILQNMQPILHDGEYVFCLADDINSIDSRKILAMFREEEGFTIIVEKMLADEWGLPYTYIAAWITLNVHSSLEAVGFTAAFSKALTNAGISCNVFAANYHDHIFVHTKDAIRAMKTLQDLSKGNNLQ